MYTSDDLKQMQAWSLERKIQVTQKNILEWYTRFNGNVYVSFSGGKDSTVLVDLARRAFPDIPVVFVDTGLEYPEVRKFAMAYPNVTVLKPVMPFNKVIEKYGYPVISKEQSQFLGEAMTTKSEKLLNTRLHGNKSGRGKVSSKWMYLLNAPFKISHKCCSVMKKNPSKSYEKETGRHPIIATMACESSLRKQQWMDSGCNAFDAARPISKPMSFWTENDVLEYLQRFKIPFASIYGDIVKTDVGG